MKSFRHSRRVFLVSTAAVGGALVLGFSLAGRRRSAPTPLSAANLNAFVRIGTDDVITLNVPCSEMGQGIHTGLAQVLAEELDADWNRIRVEVPQPDPPYLNPAFHLMLTVSSQSMRQFFEPMRLAGAAARTMLIEAAARRWNVTSEQCRAEKSRVLGPAGRSESFGALAAEASQLAVPAKPRLKPRSAWTLIGTSQRRLELDGHVDGTALFGTDVQLPGLLHAALRQAPLPRGSLKAIANESAVRARPGVRAVLVLEPSAVAVVADSYWQALSACDQLEITWNDGSAPHHSSATIDRELRAAIARDTAVGTAESAGDPAAALAAAKRIIDAEYSMPFLAHASMEPPAATAQVRDGRCDVWVGTQGQTFARGAAAEVTGLEPSRVFIHTTLLGGGFGRKSRPDFVVQAVRTAMHPALAGRPVRLLWSRGEDLQHDFYRPVTRHRLRGAFGPDGLPSAWVHRIASPSIALSVTPFPLDNGVDRIVVEGATDLPYRLPARVVEYAHCDVGIPVGFWRSVGWSATTFAVESFVDELAHAAGRDPCEYRLALLVEKPRHAAVLRLAAERAGWQSTPPKGRYRGIAMCEADGSVCAQVAEISLEEKTPRVHRIVCAVDCGTVINPSMVEAQVVGATLYGLSAALHEAITIEGGRVVQSNLADYPLLRIGETPAIETHLIESDAAPSGVGEIATAPIAAAVCNALFAATGKRVRALPVAAAT